MSDSRLQKSCAEIRISKFRTITPMNGTIKKCGIVVLIWSSLLAYSHWRAYKGERSFLGQSPRSLAIAHCFFALWIYTTSLTLNEPYPVAHSLASLVPCRPHPIPGLPFCHTLGLGLAFSIHSAWVGSYHSLTTLSIHPLSLRIIFTQLLLTLTWPWLSSHFTTILSYFYYSPLSLTWPWLSSHSSHSSSLFLPASDSDLTSLH